MLYIVLALVLAAFGLLIAALTTANTLWAWLSVVLSVVAAALLVTDWVNGRRRTRAGEPVRPTVVTVGGTESPDEDVEDDPDDPRDVADAAEPEPEQDGPQQDEPEQDEPVADSREPGEEPTDATDLLVVSDLGVEVRVVDEHPRYHLASCQWLTGRPTIPIAVSEARQLGFTPCARCGPDARLAAQHRTPR
ncbi:MAG: MFS transporter [Pseudonocardiaceae bacterium]|nr:MFS transporter [Pseudonocardiaceae bacterium]